MALTKYDVVSRALIKLDAEEVASFDDDTKEAKVAAMLYEGIRDSELASYQWNFNTKTIEIAREIDEPEADWSYQYSLPSDWLRTIDVTDASDNPIPFRDAGGKVLANTERAKLTYQAQIGEADMPAWFVDALVSRCMAEFAEPITGEGNVIDRAWREYDLKRRNARRIDAQSNPPQSLITNSSSTWLAARHGG